MIIIGLTIDIEYYYASMIFSMGVAATSASVSWLIKHIHDTRPENIDAYFPNIRGFIRYKFSDIMTENGISGGFCYAESLQSLGICARLVCWF